MDRRSNYRLDLELACRVSARTIRSVSQSVITENVSRHGILMRWTEGEPLPAVGSKLTVEIELPASTGFGRRMMRCQTTVVRITRTADRRYAVGLHVSRMAFGRASRARPQDLKSMPAASSKVN